MIIHVVKHTKNRFEVQAAFMEKKSADDYADAFNVVRMRNDPDTRIKYYTEEMVVHEG